jgi:hypothetical protein
MTVPTPHAGDVQSLCRRYRDAITPTSQPIVGLKEMSTGFLFGLAAGIVTGAAILSPATAWPLDAYADPYAPAPVPDPPVVLAMPAAPHFGVTLHQTAETRLLEIELLDLGSGTEVRLVTVDGRADCVRREDLEHAKGRLEAGQRLWLHIAPLCEGRRVAIMADQGAAYSKLGKPVDGPRAHQ